MPHTASPETGLSALIRKLSIFMPVGDEETAFLERLSQPRKSVEAHVDLICQGDKFSAVYLLLRGWAAKHRMTSNGERQIINFILPGSFFCLDAEVLERSDYTVTSLTPAVYAICDVRIMLAMAQQLPQLAAGVNWTEKRETAIMMEHMVSLGQRSADEAVAHLLLELYSRVGMCGIEGNGEMAMPLTQEVIGDALGLTAVHVNRMLRRLENKGLISVCYNSPRKVKLLDIEVLKKIAGFDGDYLNFTHIPRRTSAALASLRYETSNKSVSRVPASPTRHSA